MRLLSHFLAPVALGLVLGVMAAPAPLRKVEADHLQYATSIQLKEKGKEADKKGQILWRSPVCHAIQLRKKGKEADIKDRSYGKREAEAEALRVDDLQ